MRGRRVGIAELGLRAFLWVEERGGLIPSIGLTTGLNGYILRLCAMVLLTERRIMRSSLCSTMELPLL